jgi:hypothetical protein
MGTPLRDCLSVGKLLGIKVFVNEYVAYYELGKVLDFRNAVSINSTVSFEQYDPTLQIPDGVAMIWHVKPLNKIKNQVRGS